MKFHVKFFQPFENHFKLHVNFTSFSKYLVDRFEYKQIATLQTTGPKGYGNLWGKPLDLKATITYEANLCQTASTGQDFSKI
jgi:hypothetical protein